MDTHKPPETPEEELKRWFRETRVNRKKPDWPLSDAAKEYFRSYGRLGGRNTSEKHGTRHMIAIAQRGGVATRERRRKTAKEEIHGSDLNPG